MNYNFSVLMSVYIKEKEEYFKQCMESVLNQTLMPDEIVIVEDGPVTDDLQKEISCIDKNSSFEKKSGIGISIITWSNRMPE